MLLSKIETMLKYRIHQFLLQRIVPIKCPGIEEKMPFQFNYIVSEMPLVELFSKLMTEIIRTTLYQVSNHGV